MNLHLDDPIEDALRSYPLAETPLDFSKKVMQQITSPPALRFRLTWMDYALGLFLALLPAVGFFVWISLPPLALLNLEFQWQMVQASGILPILTLSLAVVGMLLFSGLLFSINLFFRPPALA